MNPYEQHRQNQFHAPLCSIEMTADGRPLAESCFVIPESTARAIVAAIDNNRPHKAALLIKGLPWFNSILSGVRNTRHLDPVSYIALSERPREMHGSCSPHSAIRNPNSELP